MSGCKFPVGLIMLPLVKSSHTFNCLLTTRDQHGQHKLTGAEPTGPAAIFYPPPLFQSMLQPCYPKTATLSILLLWHSLRPSTQPRCGYWISFVCVWMSSEEKDVQQLHNVFHPPAWTETWTHTDASQQDSLDVCPCSRALVRLWIFVSSYFHNESGEDWKDTSSTTAAIMFFFSVPFQCKRFWREMIGCWVIEYQHLHANPKHQRLGTRLKHQPWIVSLQSSNWVILHNTSFLLFRYYFRNFTFWFSNY